MSTVYWLLDSIQESENFKRVIFESDKTLAILVNTEKGDVEYIIYRAPKNEYVLGIKNIEEANELGANIVVYDQWGEVTKPARDLAYENNLKVQSFGQFMHNLNEGKCII